MENRKRKSFPKEFKDNAVKLVVEGGERVNTIAHRLNISAGLLSRWKREFVQRGEDRFVGKGHQTELEAENRRLRRENARLQEERAIFKKAVKFFSQETP
jgi:transposase